MNKVLKLTLPLPVSVNHYLSHRISKGKGKKFIQTYKTSEAMLFERIAKPIIKEEVIKQGWEIPDIDEYIRVEATWFLHKKGIDCSNLHKQALDIMQGFVYHNDSMVLECTKDYFIDSKNPHCELVIYTSTKQGVFKDKKEKKTFCEANCYKCSKKKTSCSFYKKLLENRIIPEVDLKENVCYKIKLKKGNSKNDKNKTNSN